MAYVSDDSAIHFKNGDTLIVDASEGAIKAGLTSAAVLSRAVQKGAEVFSLPNLHAKVYVFDGTAIIGSSNTSISSAYRLLEAAVITDEPSVTSAARKLIGELQEKSERLGKAEIRRLLKLPVERRFSFTPKNRRAPAVNPKPGATWLVATHNLDLKRYSKEVPLAERGLLAAEQSLSRSSSEAEWIRFYKASNIAKAARVDDWVIQMWSAKVGSRTRRVLRRAPIRYIQRESNCVRIYLENFKNSESEELSWRTFTRIAKDAVIPKGRLGRKSIGLLTDAQADSLESLWATQIRTKPKR